MDKNWAVQGQTGQSRAGRPGKKTWEILGYDFQDMVFRTWDLNFGAWEILGYGFQDMVHLVRASVCLTRQFCVLIRRQNRPGQSDGRTDRFSIGEPARTDGLCIISTNARWSVSLWRGFCRGRGRVLKIVTRPVVDQSGYQAWFSWLSYISVVWYLEPGGSLKFFHPPKLGALFDFANFLIPGT